MDITPLVDKYALYYPYIHLRDATWTKATLLWFGQLRRIVPLGYQINDLPDIATLANLEGPAGKLIESARLTDARIGEWNYSLLTQIDEHLPKLQSKFGSDVTPQRLRNSFEIYREKFLLDREGRDLVQELLDRKLAWESGRSERPAEWVGVHPELGSALMSSLALAVARNEGLNIVTDRATIHEGLLSEKEEGVFQKLTGLPVTHRTDAEDLSDDLGQLILTTQFDVSVLDGKDIVKLLTNKKDLRSFRMKVAEAAGAIPPEAGPEERIERLNAKKDELIDEWKECSSLFPKSLRETFTETSTEEIAKTLAEGLPEVGAAIAAKTVTAHVVAGLPGLCLAILAGAGVKMWRKEKSPLKFLNRMDRSIGKGIESKTGSLYLPQWRKL